MMKRWPYYLALLWLFLILVMGGWWLYLMMTLSTLLSEQLPHYQASYNIYHMLKWEGLSFFVLLILLSCTVVYLFIRDRNKTKSMQNFFGLMAHEMKTPLAAIQVQAESLVSERNPAQVEVLANRLRAATQTFSHFINNVLQLSSIEMGDQIRLTAIPLERLLSSLMKWLLPSIKGEVHATQDITDLHVLGDVRALEIIFSNLFNNIHFHSQQAQNCTFSISFPSHKQVEVVVSDDGQGISAQNFERLLIHIHKRNFSKKNGFGLYLVTRLMKLQKGSIHFQRSPQGQLLVSLRFQKIFQEEGQ